MFFAMTVSILEVNDRAGLERWVRFPLDHYRGDPRFVPQLLRDELDFFSPERNPAFRIADTRLVLAEKDGRTVGRVCGIIHGLETAKLGYKRGRFGWFESIEDAGTAAALLGHLERWFCREGCREMTGPHGFSDLDPEGLLVEGFEAQPTIAGSYNKPYYAALIEGLGFRKEVDYIEHRFAVPEETPALFRMMEKKALPAARAEGLKLVTGLTKKGMLGYADPFWEALEAAFAHLYGVTPLTAEQKRYYAEKYFGYIDPRFVQLALGADGRLRGFFLGLPSLSRGFQRARGRLFPLGFLHILMGFRRFDTLDFYFAGVHPEANPQRVLPLMILGMWESVKAQNVRFIETNRELETNTSIVSIWSRFDVVSRRRSRIYRKELPPA
jgi:hypothetical protein